MYDELYSCLKQIKYTGSNQIIALCPFHQDSKASFSADLGDGLFYCHSCNAKGNGYQFAEQMNMPNPHKYIKDNGSYQPVNQVASGDLDDKPKISQEKLNILMNKFKCNLKNNMEKFPQSIWNETRIDEFGLGMDDDGNWTFGYYDKDELIGIKVHKKRQYGDGSSKWFIANNIAKFDRTKDLYICEGEKDVLSLLSIGKQAISGTTGAKSIPKDLEWISEWDNDIWICYDNDEAGRMGSDKLANKLIEQYPHLFITIIEWPKDKPNGYDVTDSMEDYYILDTACLNGKQVKPSNRIGGLKMLSGTEAILMESRPRKAIIENLLPEKSQVILGGTTGANKSFMAMQMGMALANNESEFLGFNINQKGLKVLFCDTECGQQTLVERFKKISKNFNWDNKRFNMVVSQGIESNVYDDLEIAVERFKPDLLIIDCLYNTTDGADISRNDKIKPILNRISKIKNDNDITILAVHHMVKGNHQDGLSKDRMQGGSALQNWIEHIVLITRTNESSTRLLKVDKSRHLDYSEAHYVIDWDSDKCLLENRGVTDDWSKMLITHIKKNNWDRVLRELPDEFTTNDFKNVTNTHMKVSERTATNWLRDMCKCNLVEKVKHSMYVKKLSIIKSEG